MGRPTGGGRYEGVVGQASGPQAGCLRASAVPPTYGRDRCAAAQHPYAPVERDADEHSDVGPAPLVVGPDLRPVPQGDQQLEDPEGRIGHCGHQEPVQIAFPDRQRGGDAQRQQPGTDHLGPEWHQLPGPEAHRSFRQVVHPGRAQEQHRTDAEQRDPLGSQDRAQPPGHRPGDHGYPGALPRLLDHHGETGDRDQDVDRQPDPCREPGAPAAVPQVEDVQVDDGRHQGQHGEHGHGDHGHPDLPPLAPPEREHGEQEARGVRGADERGRGPDRDRPREVAIGEARHHQQLVGGQQGQHREGEQHLPGRRQHPPRLSRRRSRSWSRGPKASRVVGSSVEKRRRRHSDTSSRCPSP